MSYKVEINCLKSVDRWGKDGAEGKGRDVDAWSNYNVIERMPEINDIDRLLDRYDLEFSKFSFMPDDELNDGKKRFTFCRIENNEGEEDDNGNWLADYDIYVAVDKVEPVECPDFGLPRI